MSLRSHRHWRTWMCCACAATLGCSEISGLNDFRAAARDASGGGGGFGDGGATQAGAGGGSEPCPNLVLELKESTTDFVEVADAAEFDGLSAFTIEAWVRVDSAIAADESHVVSHHGHFSNQGWALMVNNLNVEFRVYDGSWKGVVGGPIVVDAWTHIAGVYDGTQVHAYVDGAGTSGATAAPPSPYAGPLRLGRAAYSDEFAYVGRMDDVRLSGVVRYPSVFTPPRGPLQADNNTIALWRFQDSGAQVVADGGDHPGTLMGGAVRIEDACPITAQ
jgi:hypothetical protein